MFKLLTLIPTTLIKLVTKNLVITLGVSLLLVGIFTLSQYQSNSQLKSQLLNSQTQVDGNKQKLASVSAELDKLKNEDQVKKNADLQQEINQIHTTYQQSVTTYESLQDLYKLVFEHAGYRVETAASGSQALDRIVKQRFDVILLDLLMLGMSGLDVLRQYNFQKNSPVTKVVVISNLDSPNIVQKAESFGITKYLKKSDYTPQELVDVVSKLIGESPERQSS